MKHDQIEVEQQDVKDTEQVAALAVDQSALVAYQPKSKAPYQLDTLIPRNMSFEVQKAINRVIRINGNIDNYVRNALKYPGVEKMWRGLAAEQVDSIGLYLNQFEKGQGMIIADQTGIGKGRQAAAIIRHSIVSGYLPVFFTRKPDLFTDMYRDLKSIDFADIHPFMVNTARIKDAEGRVVFNSLSAKEQFELLTEVRIVATESPESIEWHKRAGKKLPDPEKQPTIELTDTLNYLPTGYDCIFCTYSQIQAAHPYKRLWLASLVAAGIEGSTKFKKTVFILDESHMAGGFDSNIGKWMRSVLPETRSCCYLSATFAKYPQVMPLYGKKTAIQETKMDDHQFVSSMQWGGLALQEIVASNLAESGQLIRRQRSNEGIRVDYITLDGEPQRSVNRERVNRVIQLMNQVVDFEQKHIVPLLSSIHAETKAQGEFMDKVPKRLGVKQSPYFSRVFSIIDQMLFSLKVEQVAALCLKLLDQDKKVVIAFKSTMGTFLKDLNLVSGDIVLPEQLDFARTLVKGLDSVFYYSHTDIEGNKTRERIEPAKLSVAGLDEYERIKQAMKAESTGLSISPIDQLIQIIENSPKNKKLGGHIGSAFKVAEVTGRNQRISLQEDEAIVQSFRTDGEKFFRQFNSGDYDVLLINQSGSTGSSAHASMDFKDRRVRAMIIHQFELDINTEVQKRGRINRTGQVVLPEYYYITSDIPAEKRLMTMLKGKLKSLDANTTGSQKTSEETLKSADFFNKYGDKVAWQWVGENELLTARMGHPTYHKQTDKQGHIHQVRNESKDGAIRQLTGRAGLLNVDEQETLYDDLLERYTHQVEWEKQRGTYDLEVEFLKLDADIQKRYLYKKGGGGKTPFGKDTVRDQTIINNLKRPFTKDEVDKRVSKKLGDKKPDQLRFEQIHEIKQQYPAIQQELIKSRQESLAKIEIELEELPEQDSAETEKERSKIEHYNRRLQQLIQERKEALSRYQLQLKNIGEQIIRNIGYWSVAEVVKVPIMGTDYASWGIYLGVKIGKANNPYTLSNVSLLFAVADSRKLVEYKLTTEQRGEISRIYSESKDLTQTEKDQVHLTWNDLVRTASNKREKRHILTENIVGAADNIGTLNKLIKYNTKEGEIKNGILLHPDFGREDEDQKTLMPISLASDTIKALAVDELFSDHQQRVKFKRITDQIFQLFIPKRGNYQVHTDPVLRALILKQEGQGEDEAADFVQNANDMTATSHINKLDPLLERLDFFGLKFLTEAKELEGWEIENEKQWQNKTRSLETFRYRLGRPYGQGSNPIPGFTDYLEPDADHPYGVVEYSRPLSDSEKYNYSLIPIFNNPNQPYRAWKAHIEGTTLKLELEQNLEQLKNQPIHRATRDLGYFITNNPHEEGNPEFVFGNYNETQLGRAAYVELLPFVGQ